MSTRCHFFLIGRQQPQAENKSRVALDVVSRCAATRVALDLFGATATFAYRERNAKRLTLRSSLNYYT
jgi:hypothetical protein